MKRIIVGIWVLCLLLFACFLASYIGNEHMIKKYEKGENSQNKLSVLAFTQNYIKYYNQGNIYYNDEMYDLAIEEYDKALENKPPHDRECQIRINKALAMVMPINPEEINADNLDETLAILDEAQTVLTEHGCAAEGYDVGHNSDAEQLYNDIEDFKDQLQEQSESSNSNQQQQQSQQQQQNQQSSVENYEERQDQLNELQSQATEDRYSALEEYGNLYNYDYYSGATW